MNLTRQTEAAARSRSVAKVDDVRGPSWGSSTSRPPGRVTLWALPLALAVVGILAGVLLLALAPQQYRATAAVAVTVPLSDTVPDGAQARAIAVRVAQDSAALGNAENVVSPVLAQSGVAGGTALWEQRILVTGAQESPIVSIEVTGPTAADAVLVADGVATRLRELIADRNPGAEIDVLGVPYRSSGSALPGPLHAGGIGGMAGLAVGLFLAVWAERRGDRLRGVSDVRAVTDLPLVGVPSRRWRRRPLVDTGRIESILDAVDGRRIVGVAAGDPQENPADLTAEIAEKLGARDGWVVVLDLQRKSRLPALLEPVESNPAPTALGPAYRTKFDGVAYLAAMADETGKLGELSARRRAEVLDELCGLFTVVIVNLGWAAENPPALSFLALTESTLLVTTAREGRRSTLGQAVSTAHLLGVPALAVHVRPGRP